jgi:hypothetical protein
LNERGVHLQPDRLRFLFLLGPAIQVRDDVLAEVPGTDISISITYRKYLIILNSLPNQSSTTELDRELLAFVQSSSANLRRWVRESTVTKDLVELSLMVVVSMTSRVVDPADVDHNVQRVHWILSDSDVNKVLAAEGTSSIYTTHELWDLEI